MKFYVYKNSLLHECKRSLEIYYDNLYIVNKYDIYCDKCGKSAPISIILGFEYKKSRNQLYMIVGEKSLYYTYYDTKIIKILKSLKSFEIEE